MSHDEFWKVERTGMRPVFRTFVVLLAVAMWMYVAWLIWS